MKGKQEAVQQRYRVHDRFMLRVPWLPVSVLAEFTDCSSPAELLREYYSDGYLQEAIFLASPGLYRRMQEYMQDGTNSEMPEKLCQALSKYLIRMSSRCTPFGRFAGICSGTFADKTQLRLGSEEQHRLQLRPDMQFLCSLVEKMKDDRSLRSSMRFYPNSSLCMLGDVIHYVEYSLDEEGYRKYSLQQAENSPELREVLRAAECGSFIGTLAGMLSNEHISPGDAREYIHQLIDNQVLVAELEPKLSGNAYLENLQMFAPKGRKPYPLLEELNTIAEDMQEYRVQSKNLKKHPLDSLLQKGRSTGIAFREHSFIQADLKIHARECKLQENIRTDLEGLIPLLHKLCPDVESPLLGQFRKAFYRRYEEEEVPLLLALDPEAGPGYLPGDRRADDSALLADMKLQFSKNGPDEISWSGRDRLMFHKLQQALISGSFSVEISQEEMEALPGPEAELPLSFSALARVHGPWNRDPGRRIIQLESVGGSTAGRLAARFAYLDKDLGKSLIELCDIEQNHAGDKILAEIIHLPQQRTGNVLMRPVMRKYEIPYLGQSAIDPQFRIFPGDLMLSLRNDRFRLRSRRLNKTILPRLTNAHNYGLGSLAVYRFLCDLQFQGVHGHLGFTWGPLEQETIFLPRLCYRNFILKRACWNLNRSLLRKLLNASGDSALRRAADELRFRYHIPAQVLLAMGDNDLWLNLENPYCLKLLKAEAGALDSLQLHEFLCDGSDAVVRSGKGAHTNEFVFFISREHG